MNLTRICSNCKIEKSLSEFWKDKSKKAGCHSQCIPCCHRIKEARLARDPSFFLRERHRGRVRRESNVEKERERGRLKAKTRKVTYQRMSFKNRSRNISRTAVKNGKLKKPSCCEICKEVHPLTIHHLDYAQPLNVQFLCSTCHGKQHRLKDDEGIPEHIRIHMENIKP